MKNKKEQQISVPKCGYFLGSIYFYMTEGCNLKCRHCWIAPKYQNEESNWPSIDFELFKDIIRQGKKLGLQSVKLTGGEPLIHPDINKVLDYLSGENLRVTIETNGVKCTPEIINKILKCKNPFVSVSIMGLMLKPMNGYVEYQVALMLHGIVCETLLVQVYAHR